MSLFKRLFSPNIQPSNLPEIQFGRYSDSYKKEIKYDAWDRALKHYVADEYIQAYRMFFKYLTDDEQDNIVVSEEKGIISFTLYQGSKIIKGTADTKKIYAEAKIAKLDQPNIAIYRQLLEENYQLKYSRYAIDGDQNISIVFSAFSLDGSPYKLYYALKELAVTADSTDDVLVSKYSELKPINYNHIRKVTDGEKDLKYEFFKNTIKYVFDVFQSTKLDLSKDPGGISYLYLDAVYKLDFLLKPEGYTMDAFAKINSMYFKDKIKSVQEKNIDIHRIFEVLYKISKEDFYKELYEVKSTFGVTSPSGQGPIADFILDEVANMNWYLKNDHQAFALAIPSYIVGCSLYQYSLPDPMRELFLLFYKVVEYPFFESLGFNYQFVIDDGILNRDSIVNAIKQVVNKYEVDYSELKFEKNSLVLTDVYTFAKSYLRMIAEMNFSRKDMK